MTLKGQASALETTLKQAETDKANAQKVSDQAEAELKLAQTALAEAKAKLQALLDVLEAENMLKVAEKDGMIIGLPKNAPIQDPLPELIFVNLLINLKVQKLINLEKKLLLKYYQIQEQTQV